MKKLLVSVIVTMFLASSVVYAEKEVFLPEAQNDFVYTAVPDELPLPTASPK